MYSSLYKLCVAWRSSCSSFGAPFSRLSWLLGGRFWLSILHIHLHTYLLDGVVGGGGIRGYMGGGEGGGEAERASASSSGQPTYLHFSHLSTFTYFLCLACMYVSI